MNNIKINKLLKYVEQFYKLAQTDAGVPAGVPTNQPLQPPTAPKAPNTTPEPNTTPAPKQAPKQSGIGKNYLYHNNVGEVNLVQDFLKRKGLYKGTVDSKFGDQTAAALMQWQKNNKLPPTARLDPATMTKLMDAIQLEKTENAAPTTIDLDLEDVDSSGFGKLLVSFVDILKDLGRQHKAGENINTLAWSQTIEQYNKMLNQQVEKINSYLQNSNLDETSKQLIKNKLLQANNVREKANNALQALSQLALFDSSETPQQFPTATTSLTQPKQPSPASRPGKA